MGELFELVAKMLLLFVVMIGFGLVVIVWVLAWLVALVATGGRARLRPPRAPRLRWLL